MLIDNRMGHRSPMEAMEGIRELKRLHSSYRVRRVQLSHEMPEETAETSARTLIRTVPVIYGLLLGAVLDNLLIGVSLGLGLSLALDMRMGKHSFSRPLLGPVLAGLRWLVNAAAHGLAWLLGAIGLPRPVFIHQIRYRSPRR